MSGTESSLNKAIAYVFIGFVVVSVVLGLTFFLGPRTSNGKGLFQTSIRFFTKGTEELYYSDYAQAIVQDIQEVGIEVVDYPMEYSTFLDTVFGSKGFDLAIIEIEQQNAPHLELFFKPGASLNVFNFQDSIDQGQTNEFIENITQETDFYTRKNYFRDLQEHLMNNVLPMVPLFTPVRTFAYWGNVAGFSAELGLSHSLPYMYFNGLREGQTESTIFKAGISRWFDLNPLSMREDAEKTIVSIIMDKLIEIDEKGSLTKTGLIDNWEFINRTTLHLHVRSGVEWQPDPEETSFHVPFTIDDLMFTLDALRSLETNLNYELFDWIKSYEEFNDTTVELIIDSNSTTVDNDPYAFALEDLSVYPLPKHYLNPSDDPIATVANSDEWETFCNAPFGTGKYKYSTESNIDLGIVVLNRFDDWHGVGVKSGETTNLVFETLELQTYPEYYSMIFDLRDGTVLDLADLGKHPSKEEEVTLEPNILVDYAVEDSIIFLAFNLENSVFGSDNNFVPTNQTGVSKALAIRKAIAHAIDKPSLNSALHNDGYNITETPLSQYYVDYYHPSVTTYDFSINKAIEYLQLAGFNITTYEDYNTNQTPFDFAGFITGLGVSVFIIIAIKRKTKGRKNE